MEAVAGLLFLGGLFLAASFFVALANDAPQGELFSYMSWTLILLFAGGVLHTSSKGKRR